MTHDCWLFSFEFLSFTISREIAESETLSLKILGGKMDSQKGEGPFFGTSEVGFGV